MVSGSTLNAAQAKMADSDGAFLPTKLTTLLNLISQVREAEARICRVADLMIGTIPTTACGAPMGPGTHLGGHAGELHEGLLCLESAVEKLHETISRFNGIV